MLKKYIIGYFVAFLAVATICATAVFGMVLPNYTKSADAAVTRLQVQKVQLPDVYSNAESYDPTELRHVNSTATTINENDFVILNTTATQYVDDEGENFTGREAILIYFPGSRQISTLTIRFNDRLIVRNEVSETDEESYFVQYLHALTPEEVNAVVDPNASPTYTLNPDYMTVYQSYSENGSSNVAVPEGKYEIIVTYYDETTVGTSRDSITFYVTTQKTYTTVNENPTYYDTEKFVLSNQDYSTLHYFNYNNIYTTFYNSQTQSYTTRTSKDKLYYPQIYYNPEKYQLSYTRTLYNYTETVTLNFSVTIVGTEETGHLLVTISTNSGQSNTREYLIRKSGNTFQIKLQFDQPGEYVINKTPILRTGISGNQATYIRPDGNLITVNTSNEDLLKPEQLIINGYSAMYADSNTTTAPLYNDTYSYNTMENVTSTTPDVVYARDFLTYSTDTVTIETSAPDRPETTYTADFSFMNESSISTSAGISINQVDTSTVFSNFNLSNQYITKASTNQAPVVFNYYGRLVTGNSSDSPSWYAYRDTQGNVTIQRYTRGMTFQNAGEYIVYLTYENVAQDDTQGQTGLANQNQHQIFYFEITNTTPELKVYAYDRESNDTTPPTLMTEASILNMDDYTNKYVYASWAAAGPFDAKITAKYSVYDWDGNPIRNKTDLEFNGLVYQESEGGAIYDVSENEPTVLFGERKSINNNYGTDGYYLIQVFKNDSVAYINYTFAIDTSPITGIGAVSVLGDSSGYTVSHVDGEVNYVSLLDESDPSAFNLISASAFGWTWNEKRSGAPITAKYVYASITTISNFSLITTNAEDFINNLTNQAQNGAVLMPTNASLGGFTPAIDYTKVQVDLESLGNRLSNSQVINTPQLAILLLTDAAGNTAIFATLLDNTNTQVYQYPEQSSYVNVITEDTNFYWGTHKGIEAQDVADTETEVDQIIIDDIYDFKDNEYVWNLNGANYEANNIIINAFNSLGFSDTNKYLMIALEQVDFETNDNNDATIYPTVVTEADGSQHAENWWATIKVELGATENDEDITRVVVDGVDDAENRLNHPDHSLNNGEFMYTLVVFDGMYNDNNGGLTVEVNLDRSLGSLRSYSEFYTSNGSDLAYNRTPTDANPITDRQYVPNTYSTNRRYITFSWTEPTEYFAIESIKLEFYALSYDTSSPNYPYGQQATTTTLYDRNSLNYSTAISNGSLFEVTGEYNGHYQTNVLMRIEYSQYFGGAATQEGMFVITRTYTDESWNEAAGEDYYGDVKEKTYTYYVDRNDVIPSDTSLYGSDINLQFGYDKGEYPGYPDYGSITFNQFSRSTSNDTFSNIAFDRTDLYATNPSSVVIDSNIPPASLNLSYWIEDTTGNPIYDKYYYSVEGAEAALNEIFAKYQNTTRIQIAVQYFRKNVSMYSFAGQTFYTTRPTTTDYLAALNENESLPLSELENAFTGIGRYRIILFDMSNYDGILSGRPYTDFTRISYSSLTPNYTVINFELTGEAPSFNFQTGENNYTNIDVTVTRITNDSKTRITWSDPADIYTAQIAFNDVQVITNVYTKDSPRLNTDGSTGTSVKTSSRTFSDPVLLTSSESEYNELKESDPEGDGVRYIYGTESELQAIINKGLTTSELAEAEFYKMAVNNIYNYYLLLPIAPIENPVMNATKLADIEYTATVHYIAKDESDYEVNGTVQNYQTTQTLYNDHTAPYWNLRSLIQNDAFINEIGNGFADYLIENIDNYDVDFLKSYAFAVPIGWKLYYQNEYESGTYFYYFKRDDYTGEKANQTVVAGDPNYSNANYRFSTSDPYVRATYANDNTAGTSLTEVGYYDIIEQDRAGNLRVYTVYVTDNIQSVDGTIGENSIHIESNSTGSIAQENGVTIFDRGETIILNGGEFNIDDISSEDRWMIISFENQMGSRESLTFCYVPSDAQADITRFSGYSIVSSLDEVADMFNSFIDELYLNYQTNYGSQIKVTINDRLPESTFTFEFYVNTEGQLLITSEDDFLNLITSIANNTMFTIKLPDTTNIPSTKLTTFQVFRNNDEIYADDNFIDLPVNPEDFESDQSINIGYTFGLPNNATYRFVFIDNFGRRMVYSYPIDSDLIRYVTYSGGTTEYAHNDVMYTYTSNDVRFTYQSSGLRVKLTITDFDTDSIIYTNVNGDTVDSIDTQSPYFTYIQESITSNVIILLFNANIGIHYHVHLEVDNYTDTATIFDFVIYTHFPNISVTDSSGSPIMNNLTSKSVIISWNDIAALFNPYVTLTYPDGTTENITSPVIVDAEGTYTIGLHNDLGQYMNGTRTFTIQEYDISIYGVYQITTSGELVQLYARDDSYSYFLNNVEITMPHYMFLSSDSNWDRNIEILYNEDKGLNYEVIDTVGNTRIYRVYGETTHVLSVYFAVTRIPNMTISSYTNFRINGETTNRASTIETDPVTITWQTSFTDNSAQPDGTFQNTYYNYFSLELRYNGTIVGNYTSGSITLTNSGVYEIRILDPVGQVNYFASNSSRFSLTLLTNVIYSVNDNAAIPYATYSSDVTVNIPNLSYYDNPPEVTITRNNIAYTITPTEEGDYVFTQPGVYKISMRASIQNIEGTNAEDLVANYQFTLYSPNEALRSYSFPAMSGYEIVSIVRSGLDITDLVRGDDEKITSLYIDSETWGVGRYTITVRTTADGYIPSQDYTYNIWINNETVSITASRDWGSTSTSSFTLTINPATFYERIGDSKIMVNGQLIYTINAETGAIIDPVQIANYSTPGDYTIQVLSASDTLLQSHRITIKEPLNTAAIILIVVACIVIVGLIITFIILRHRIKVR